MKKIIVVLALLFLSLAFLNAAPGEHDDIIAFLAQQTKMMDECVTNMDKATNENEVAAVITKLKDDLNALIPIIKVLVVKYPEMEKIMETNPSEDLKVEVDKMKAVTVKMGPSMMKIKQFVDKEVVTKALMELNEVTAAIGALDPQKEAAPAPEATPAPEVTPEKEKTK